MEALIEKLTRAGLTGNEAKIYLRLLEKGELPANQLAKNLGMDRTLTYTMLNHLIEKGFVSYVIKQNKKMFQSAPPENLLNPIKEKEVYITDLISELSKIKKEDSTEYEVKVYEGKEGVRTLMKKIISYKHFDSFGGTGRAYDLLYELPAIAKELVKKGYTARLIINSKYKEHEITKIKSLKTRYLDLESEASTTIFGDYVSIHLIKDKPIVIIIKNKEIAQSYKNHFEVLWKSALNKD